MKFFHSIRWRLQLWHGLLLVVVLAGFGFTAWRLQRATQFQRVDQELERRISPSPARCGPRGSRPAARRKTGPRRRTRPGQSQPSAAPLEVRCRRAT